ncbi:MULTISPECIES: nucleotidyltransferase family protein [Rhizobium]|uniref:Nucleotidyltransferase family protein n=1 Tax=Rhizobium rhododendri TaxID=2506430 RepID=A0ABY8IKR3_9HYPH|nr:MULTISPECIES: nucleotidyltransferase family protein [Rhizobium]MBZ5758164.1 nucleotidyltransferase family protein [Rhizobium sp. VS19-DR96]MBZ5765006.1 nucleotidyltransferase family protein [Rhizobium sp. VS19-DR129.2]MBZ5772549.1 nucleotidyltransferase family protein [Rhizobium sp. VS19-DRK62.2]MBZ5782764.1 nucleotidyltransferase family protein [Rhizobium sp. VS19-DR121]MBZ5800212.1 nucleotidyltransferase family protein [Rhizobium sp. VS19-DR181]
MASPVPILGWGGSLMPEKIARYSVAIVVLAAGKASRMGGPHKLLATFDGIPLVTVMVERACATGAPVFVVTGHRHLEITAALAGLDIENVYNPDFESGMASSLVAGFGAVSASGSVGVLVMLADMPGVETSDLMALIQAFQAAGGEAIVRAVSDGERGNPVILPISLRSAVMALRGDVGARGIIDGCGLPVVDVEIGRAAHLDVDTPDAVLAAGGTLKE